MLSLLLVEPLRVMAIFGTCLLAGRGSEPVWFRGPKTSPKVPVIYRATSGGPNPKLMMTLKKLAPPPLKLIHLFLCYYFTRKYPRGGAKSKKSIFF